MMDGKYDRDSSFFLSDDGASKKLRASLNLLDFEFRKAISNIKIKISASEMDAGDPFRF